MIPYYIYYKQPVVTELDHFKAHMVIIIFIFKVY